MSQRHILLLQILQYDSDCLYISVSNGTCILSGYSLLCRLFARCIAIFSFASLILHTPCETCCVDATCHNHEGSYHSTQPMEERTAPERNAFSNEEDSSDEDESECEEVTIPKKKRGKRKRQKNQAASSKRIKPISKAYHP